MLSLRVLLVDLILLQLLFSHSSATSNLIKAAVNVSSTYYDPQFVTTVIWKQNNSNCVNDFLRSYQGSVVLSPWHGDADQKIRAINETVGFKQTIYFGTTLHEFEKFMKLINELIRFPVRFILVLENTIEKHSELSAFIKVASENDQTNLGIISANKKDEITLATFFPYSDGLCRNYTPVLLKTGDNMFPKKFTNFYQCPIRITLLQVIPFVVAEYKNGKIINVGGYEGKIFMAILNKLNASLEVTKTEKVGVYGSYVNGTATGLFGDLTSEKADVIVPGTSLTHRRYSITFTSHIYRTVDIRWIGPKPREVNDWLKFLVPDRTNCTPLHFIVFITFVFSAMLIRKCKMHLVKGKNQILFHSFIILLGQSAKFISKSSLLNGIFLLWIWFCYFFRIDYLADLVNALQTSSLESAFESVEEAVKKLDGYGGNAVIRDYYKDTPLEKDFRALSTLEIKNHIKRVFHGERFLLALDITFLRELYNYFQILEQRVSATGACFYMRPGWPAANDVDDVIVDLVEKGFIENIIGNGNLTKWLIKTKLNDDDALKPKVLSFMTLSSCFYGLVFMWIICFIVLLLEIIYHNNKSQHHHV